MPLLTTKIIAQTLIDALRHGIANPIPGLTKEQLDREEAERQRKWIEECNRGPSWAEINRPGTWV